MNDLATVSEGGPGTVLQCEACLRYFKDGVLALGLSLAEIGCPESFVCGGADCGAIAEEILRAQRAVDAQAQQAVARERVRIREVRERVRIREVRANAKSKVKGGKRGCGVRAGRSRGAVGGPSPQFERGCPVDTEPLADGPLAAGVGSVGSSQAEFLGAVDVGPALARLLEHFKKHFGEWCGLPVLEVVCGHHAVNSRCSELREVLSRSGDFSQHDIDQMNLPYEPTGRVHSHYRLCLKSESVRLKRKAQRDVGQGELTERRAGAEG